MNSIRILSKSFTVKLTVLITLTVVMGILVSAGFSYFYAEQKLGETYAQKLLTLSIYKYAIIKNSFYIYVVFTALTSLALVIFSIYNSHKVTGPLFRIRAFAKEMSRGNFGIKIKFRSGDVIQPLGETADGFSSKYGKLYRELNAVVDEMQKDTLEITRSIEEKRTEDSERLRILIDSEAKKLKEILSRIKT